MSAAAAIVTAKGGMASHAAVIARGWGIPAVVGVEALSVDDAAGVARLGDVELRDGDAITVDGSGGPPSCWVPPRWATWRSPMSCSRCWGGPTICGARGWRCGPTLMMRPRPGWPASSEPTGVGLCRTEHMFLGDRLPLIQRAITDGGPEALDALAEAQVDDLGELLEVMDGLPVTVRLLDPPLHEFSA